MIPGKWISSIQAEAQLKFNEWNKSKNEDLGRQQREYLKEREKCLAALLDEKQLQEYIKAKGEVAAAKSDSIDEDLPF